MVTDGTEEKLIRWIPLLPLMAAAVHGFMLTAVRRQVPPWATIALSCGSVSVAFLVTCVVFAQLLQLPPDGRILVDDIFTWIGAGVGDRAFSAEVAFVVDPLSAVMALLVTGVGAVVHFYSIGYMREDDREDKGFQRYFAYMNLFIFSMLVLVLADNLVLMFMGWEGVGLCSYLLIGFWYSDRHNAWCGSKAFIVNRIGDVGYLVGVFLLFAAMSDAGHPTTGFQGIERHFGAIAAMTLTVPEWLPFGPQWSLVNVAGFCIFLGACGKSAQFPLHVWLPDAMAGPTPVSALIHAATMVTAGVYLLCRLSFLYAAATEVSALIAWVGAGTALFAATVAAAQSDIKKVLAWSTVSQLGFMFVAVGCGAYTAAIFHLATHAFFKALLFLAAGSVILALHHQQDIEQMGGLRRRLPRTRWTFLAGTFAIAGIPPFAGFFSKDEIMVAAHMAEVPGHLWLYLIGLFTAGLTSFYMFRLYFKIFRVKTRIPQQIRQQLEDPPSSIIYPLYILAFFAVTAGFGGLPQAYGDHMFGGIDDSNSLANFLAPVLVAGPIHEFADGMEYWLALRAVLVASAAAGIAWWIYVRRPNVALRLGAVAARPARLLADGYRFDGLLNVCVVRPFVFLSDRLLFRVVDQRFIDGVLVEGVAAGVRNLATNGLKYAQSGFAQTYLVLMVLGAVALVAYLVR